MYKIKENKNRDSTGILVEKRHDKCIDSMITCGIHIGSIKKDYEARTHGILSKKISYLTAGKKKYARDA